MTKAYHFTNGKLRDGRKIPPIGKWLEHKGELVMCSRGLHASLHVFDAMGYAPGNTLHLVELGGEIIRGDDKVVASRRRIIATINAEPILRQFARKCALDVIHLWDAPEIVVRYLKTGDESIRAAAWDAASGAARGAARDAARAAAWDAAINRSRQRLERMVNAAFKSQLSEKSPACMT
jgi:hypothetical protein